MLSSKEKALLDLKICLMLDDEKAVKRLKKDVENHKKNLTKVDIVV